MVALLVLASLAPALAVILFFYRSDRFPEPPGKIIAVAAAGVFSVVLVVPLQGLLDALNPVADLRYGPPLFRAFVLAALIEEGTRYLIVLAVARSADFDEPMDGPVYAVAAAMGFAGLENLAYVFNDGAWTTALVRALTAVPSHASSAVVMGYFVSLGRFLPHHRREFYALALVVPVVMHGVYDGCLMVSEVAGRESGLTSVLIPVWVFGLLFEFDISLRLHRLLAVMQFGEALPWWIGKLPFGREHSNLDSTFRALTGLSRLDGLDLATLESAAARRPPPTTPL